MPETAGSSLDSAEADPVVREDLTVVCPRVIRARPAGCCVFFLRKAKGTDNLQINYQKSHCAYGKLTMQYGTAAQSSESSPSSNVPIRCPWCPETQPAVWKYNLLQHARKAHPLRDPAELLNVAKVGATEKELLKKIWTQRHVVKKKRKSKKKKAALTISDAHNTRNAFSTVDAGDGEEEDDQSLDDEEASAQSSPSSSDNEDEPALNDDEDADNLAMLWSPSPPRDLETRTDADEPMDVPEQRIPSTNAGPSTSSATEHGTLETATQGSKRRKSDRPPTVVPAFTAIVAPSRPGGRSRKAREYADDLGVCVCGVAVTETERAGSDAVIQCKEKQCETKWYHLACAKQDYARKAWTCASCKDDGRGEKKKRRIR
ncbi:hypothetical protein EXIGLDRAFT_844497 [Exidia glandulosa HHB12029]|uniref:Zinc finger PHD-type domain-containing protein n=1 Tax=Exidia glandulosa HHB12029 TaxID=1314781 RepID=A0A165C003_EXIGL|nr:hypothetical protein EXIGLDRAFT_844497 [Exidia glandulosa HHB12029]